MMYSVTFAIDKTDLHVQSLDSGTTEGVGEASDTELSPIWMSKVSNLLDNFC